MSFVPRLARNFLYLARKLALSTIRICLWLRKKGITYVSGSYHRIIGEVSFWKGRMSHKYLIVKLLRMGLVIMGMTLLMAVWI